MHCPNCGTKAPAGQKFCRACGFGLEKVGQLIADHQAAATDQTTGATGGLSDDRLRKLEKWAARALFALGGVLGGVMFWAIIGKVMIEKGKIFEGSIILMILAGAALASLLAYLDSERKRSASARSNQQQRMPEAVETAKMLSEPSLETVSSVTEHTTTRLEEKIDAPIKNLR
jgi:zinc-ribbon domain